MGLTNAPVLKSDRVILRGPQMADFDAFSAFHADPDRAPGFGPVYRRDESWRWFALNIGHWHIHGYGYFTIADPVTDAPIGISGIWNPDGWPEPELGWVVYAGHEGKGIAFEAATRARKWAYEDLGFTTLTSNIVPGNIRSIALAERLGATYERTYNNVHMGEDLLYRHPGPEART
ncbi:GNAT family N-acetyltransferase [Puniceibacterium sp. IMCC21224]|uniref:GNAT family N-acetyltransferase n=1 Tax=Puniceibacterium sp. IMCC21224 TaxID=1618204 RepID=UPI00064D98A7|nr:GNAT family N-acetyltransferase [Puniceibacterium sp. IMCC21224]KMK68754.1 acetyltransferase, ribosomal protein N-acetylase [Puniceibacterium sp. IMCC21224]